MKQLLTFFICIISLTTGYSATAFTSDIPYLSSYASGDYEIYPRTGGIASLSDLRKPIIVVEGYDYKGEYDGSAIYNILNTSGLASNLRQRGYEKITARVPLKEMNKYSTSLSSLTGGRGVFNMKFAAYEKVPQEVQDELLAAYAAEEKDE